MNLRRPARRRQAGRRCIAPRLRDENQPGL
jgi:hypothetical protein